MPFDTANVRFFEIDGNILCGGTRNFTLTPPDLKGDQAVEIPFGIKNFDEQQVLSVRLPEELQKKVSLMEQELSNKLNLSFPDFSRGCKNFYSMLKGQESNLLNFKIKDKTKIYYYDVKKSSFVKGKLEEIHGGVKACISFSVGRPWKMEVNGVLSWGISLILDEVIVYVNGPKEKPQKKRSIKDVMMELNKKKTKLVKYKDAEGQEDL